MLKDFINLYQYRELLFALTKREVKVRYKQTALGILWAVAQPLSLMVTFTLIFGLFLRVRTSDVPYPIFYFSALLPWLFFSTSFTFGSLSIVNNGNLITKIYFPREVLPLSSLFAAFLDFAVGGLIFMVMMIFYHIPITFNVLFLFPIIIIQIVFISSIIFLTSALIVVWRDLKFVVPLVTQLWMFAVPIIYPLEMVPIGYQFIYKLDPMVVIIENFRRVTIIGKGPNWLDLLLSTLISLLMIILSYMIFKKLERKFSDII